MTPFSIEHFDSYSIIIKDNFVTQFHAHGVVVLSGNGFYPPLPHYDDDGIFEKYPVNDVQGKYFITCELSKDSDKTSQSVGVSSLNLLSNVYGKIC